MSENSEKHNCYNILKYPKARGDVFGYLALFA